MSHLYLESRSLTLSNIRFFSDGRVRHALDTKEAREEGWRRKFSSAMYAKGLIEDVVTPVVSDESSGHSYYRCLTRGGRGGRGGRWGGQGHPTGHLGHPDQNLGHPMVTPWSPLVHP